MKRGLFLVFISIALTVNYANAQKSIQISDIELINLGDGQLYGHSRDSEKTAINGKTRIITGVTTEYIDAEFSNGYAIGKWEYYKNNKLSSYVSYENGYQNGEFAELTPGGSLKITGSFKKGKKDGEWTTYGSDENKKETEVFKDGSVIKRISYYTNGNIDSERNYKNGKEDGVSKQYTLDGTLKSEKNYVNGKQVGRQMQYYTSNQADYIQISNYSANGKKEGEFIETFVDTDNIKQKGNYVNDQKDGLWLTGTLRGADMKEETYKNGVLQNSKRTQKYTSQDGDYTSVTLYNGKGNKDGVYIETYTPGKVEKVRGTYVNNRKDGKWTYKDKSGKVTKEEVYEDGVLKK